MATSWQHDHRPPEKIMVELELTRRLEGMHVGALRIDARHHVRDHAVLACRVKSLEDDQHGPLMLGIEPLLQRAEPLSTFREQSLGRILVESHLIPGIEICEPEAGAVFDAIAFDEVRLTQTSVSVDLPADDGDGLLINARRIPTLDGREVRLPRLITSTS